LWVEGDDVEVWVPLGLVFFSRLESIVLESGEGEFGDGVLDGLVDSFSVDFVDFAGGPEVGTFVAVFLVILDELGKELLHEFAGEPAEGVFDASAFGEWDVRVFGDQ